MEQIKNILENKIDSELVEKLMKFDFNESESLSIIMSGLIRQSSCCLFQLSMKGVATTKILNFPTTLIEANESIVEFLKKLKVDESILKFVLEKGITEDAREFLNNFGNHKEKDNSESQEVN